MEALPDALMSFRSYHLKFKSYEYQIYVIISTALSTHFYDDDGGHDDHDDDENNNIVRNASRIKCVQ